jgi:hypothetical protein
LLKKKEMPQRRARRLRSDHCLAVISRRYTGPDVERVELGFGHPSPCPLP